MHYIASGRPSPDVDDESRASWELMAREPSPEQAAMLHDQIEQMLNSIPAQHRPILQAILQGQNEEETAARVGVSVRTVQRVLATLRGKLKDSTYSD